jgi:hypothetical protein
MARMSNRDRIARAAEEASLAEAEKLAKKKAKAAKPKPASKSRAKAKEVRMMIVWVIHNAQGRPVQTFAYPEQDAATTQARSLSRSTGQPHDVRATKVPME